MRPSATAGPRTRLAAACVAVAISALFFGGCRTAPPPAPEPVPAPPTVAAGFVVAEAMLDTWNTIGQVVVSLDHARYEARSQMLGLYQLRWRGEPMLVVASAVPIGPDSPGISTRVRTLSAEGAPLDSDGARELMSILVARVAAEAPRYRHPVEVPDRSRRRGRRAR